MSFLHIKYGNLIPPTPGANGFIKAYCIHLKNTLLTFPCRLFFLFYSGKSWCFPLANTSTSNVPTLGIKKNKPYFRDMSDTIKMLDSLNIGWVASGEDPHIWGGGDFYNVIHL